MEVEIAERGVVDRDHDQVVGWLLGAAVWNRVSTLLSSIAQRIERRPIRRQRRPDGSAPTIKLPRATGAAVAAGSRGSEGEWHLLRDRGPGRRTLWRGRPAVPYGLTYAA